MLNWFVHRRPALALDVALFIVMVGFVVLLPTAFGAVMVGKPEWTLTAARILVGVVALNSIATLMVLNYLRRGERIQRAKSGERDARATAQ